MTTAFTAINAAPPLNIWGWQRLATHQSHYTELLQRANATLTACYRARLCLQFITMPGRDGVTSVVRLIPEASLPQLCDLFKVLGNISVLPEQAGLPPVQDLATSVTAYRRALLLTALDHAAQYDLCCGIEVLTLLTDLAVPGLPIDVGYSKRYVAAYRDLWQQQLALLATTLGYEVPCHDGQS